MKEKWGHFLKVMLEVVAGAFTKISPNFNFKEIGFKDKYKRRIAGFCSCEVYGIRLLSC